MLFIFHLFYYLYSGIVKHKHVVDSLDSENHIKRCKGEKDVLFGHLLSYAYKLKEEKENNKSLFRGKKYDLEQLSNVIVCCGWCYKPLYLENTMSCVSCAIEYHPECFGSETEECRRCRV